MADEKKEYGIYIDHDTDSILDNYRRTQPVIPTKKEALKQLVAAGWKTVERKMKEKGVKP